MVDTLLNIFNYHENLMVDTKNNQGICCFLSLKFPLVESHSVDKSICVLHVYCIYSVYPKRAIHNSPKKKMIQLIPTRAS